MKEAKTITCKNCNHQFMGKYCSNCGQEADTVVIGFTFILKHLRKTFIRFDNGFFYTLKELFSSPGNTLKAYLEGKRINHLNPFSFVLIIAGLYSYLFLYFNIDIFTSANEDKSNEAFRNFASKHYAIIQLCIIPVLSLASVIAFPKKKYRYTELLVVNTYLTGQRIALAIVLLPFVYLFREDSVKEGYITTFAYIIGCVFFFLAYRQLFKNRTMWRVVWATIVANLMTMLFLILIVYFVQQMVLKNV